MKSRNLNFPKPSAPLQACNWTALPLPYVLGLNNISLLQMQLTTGKPIRSVETFNKHPQKIYFTQGENLNEVYILGYEQDLMQ
jgi:hypothetical protein